MGGRSATAGDGSVSDTNKTRQRCPFHNMHGDASVVTGAGAISGATGINAQHDGTGALTNYNRFRLGKRYRWPTASSRTQETVRSPSRSEAAA